MPEAIEQLKYRHIFKLMFSCCFFYTKWNIVCFIFIKLVTITDGNLSVHQMSGFSGDTEISNALVPGKKPSEAGLSGTDCSSNFFFHAEILATLLEYLQMFALLTKKKKFSIADHYRF